MQSSVLSDRIGQSPEAVAEFTYGWHRGVGFEVLAGLRQPDVRPVRYGMIEDERSLAAMARPSVQVFLQGSTPDARAIR
ncbi:hypothetical protein ACIQKE_14750 [Streptomyces griseoviridis]